MRITDTADLWWKNAVVCCVDVETYMDWDGDGCGAGHVLADLLEDGRQQVGDDGSVELTLDGYGYRWLQVVGPDSRRLL